MSEQKYTIQGTRVKGNNYGYNLTNKIDAQHLATTLNTYELKIQTLNNTQNNIDRIEKQIIQLKLTINILSEEIQQLQKLIK